MQSASPVVPFPKSDSDDVAPYRELKVERQGTTWYAFFDGRLIGSLQALEGPELPEFRLVTDGGPVLFESIMLAELQPSPSPDDESS